MEQIKIIPYVLIAMILSLSIVIIPVKYVFLALVVDMVLFMIEAQKYSGEIRMTKKVLKKYQEFEEKVNYLMSLDKNMLVGMLSVVTTTNMADLKEFVKVLKESTPSNPSKKK